VPVPVLAQSRREAVAEVCFVLSPFAQAAQVPALVLVLVQEAVYSELRLFPSSAHK